MTRALLERLAFLGGRHFHVNGKRDVWNGKKRSMVRFRLEGKRAVDWSDQRPFGGDRALARDRVMFMLGGHLVVNVVTFKIP
jgi:hypothetical protein